MPDELELKKISELPAATTPDDLDVLAGVQAGGTKQFSFATIMSWIENNVDPAALGAVPVTRTVNGKALILNIALDSTDVGAVPVSRKVNGKSLGSDVTLTASDVGARPDSWTPSASDVGLGNVANVLQYSADNPPPYPVTSVNGATGAVVLDAADVGAYVKPSGGIPASDLAAGVIPTVPSAYTSNPAMDGTASPGSSGDWARGDHVHPSDTAKRAADAVNTLLFNTVTDVHSDTTINLTAAYTGYAALAFTFVTVSGDYNKRMTVVVPVFSLRFSTWFPLANGDVSGAVRIVEVSGQASQVRVQATTLTALYLMRIDAIK